MVQFRWEGAPQTKLRSPICQVWPKRLDESSEEENVITKRRFRGLLAAGGTLAAAVVLAACGGSGIENSGGSESVQTVKYQPPPSGNLTISNWPLYIDKNTVSNFEKATGVHVN